MSLQMKRRNKALIAAIVALILIGTWIAWGNLTVKTSHFNVRSDKIPSSFNNYKIAQISDLHNAEYGHNNSVLVDILAKEKPDIIAITGDLIDSNHTDLDVALTFIEQAAKIAPCYFVTGNHEAWVGDLYSSLEERMINCGVTVLHNQSTLIKQGDEAIVLAGIDDPDFVEKDALFDTSAAIIASELQFLTEPDSSFRILLSHRPEAFEAYVANNIDLVLSGHTHAGQFRLPFIGGVFAPNQGFFPEYDSGIYTDGATSMIVSRGIGNSIIPVRINNRPEVVIINLLSA